MEMAVFALFATLAVLSALVVVVHRNPVYSVMSLVVTLISLAVLFVLLGAPFLAALQILVYTGAILVLFLFVIMLLNVGDVGNVGRESSSGTRWGSVTSWTAILGSLAMGAVVAVLVGSRTAGQPLGELQEAFVSLPNLAGELFGRYLLPFEMVGLLLLAAVIAATVLAKKAATGDGDTP